MQNVLGTFLGTASMGHNLRERSDVVTDVVTSSAGEATGALCGVFAAVEDNSECLLSS